MQQGVRCAKCGRSRPLRVPFSSGLNMCRCGLRLTQHRLIEQHLLHLLPHLLAHAPYHRRVARGRRGTTGAVPRARGAPTGLPQASPTVAARGLRPSMPPPDHARARKRSTAATAGLRNCLAKEASESSFCTNSVWTARCASPFLLESTAASARGPMGSASGDASLAATQGALRAP